MSRPRGPTLVAVLAGGVLAVSTAPLLSRAAYEAAGRGTVGAGLVLAATRLALTSVATLPAWRRPRGVVAGDRLPDGTGRRTLLAGGLLGLHFATWLPSLAFTSVAASTTIVTTGPIWVALLLWLRGERPSGRTLAGIAVAIGGGALVAVGDVGGLGDGANPPLGNLLALVAAVAYSAYLLLGRSVLNRGLGLWRWTSLVTGVGALAVAPLALAAGPGSGPYPAGFWVAAAGLALLPQVVGHTSLTWSVRWLSPTLVSVVILLEPLVATAGAYLLFDEVPGPMVGAGALVLVAGVALTTVAERPGRPPPIAGATG